MSMPDSAETGMRHVRLVLWLRKRAHAWDTECIREKQKEKQVDAVVVTCGQRGSYVAADAVCVSSIPLLLHVDGTRWGDPLPLCPSAPLLPARWHPLPSIEVWHGKGQIWIKPSNLHCLCSCSCRASIPDRA